MAWGRGGAAGGVGAPAAAFWSPDLRRLFTGSSLPVDLLSNVALASMMPRRTNAGAASRLNGPYVDPFLSSTVQSIRSSGMVSAVVHDWRSRDTRLPGVTRPSAAQSQRVDMAIGP